MNRHNHPRVAIVATGSAVPEQRVTNQDMERIVDTSDEWIVTRTGIKERRKLEPEYSNVDLCTRAARSALAEASLEPEELDLIIVATITPDYPTPSTSCLLQARLGAFNAAAMDISAGCTGFIYALTTAQQFIENGRCRNALVVGSEILSRVTNWRDRSTCVLFGDGSGAAVLQPVHDENRGILATELQADGRGGDMLIIPAGGSARPASEETVRENLHAIRMQGSEVFKFAVRVVIDTTLNLLKQAGRDQSELDYLFLHQANLRIIESARKRLNLPPERVPYHINRYGNMSSSSIPILLDEERAAGRIKPGDLVALVAFGSGLTWGGVLLRW